MDDARTMPEPTHAGGLFGRVMAQASARAKEYRARTSTGTQSPPSTEEPQERQTATSRGLPPAVWGKTFEAFDMTAASPKMRDAYQRVRTFAETQEPPRSLMLTGNYGAGKTHLAYAACNYVREAGGYYRFIRANDLMKLLRDAIDKRRHNIDEFGPDDWIAAFSRDFMLVIDDIGAHQDTDFAAACLFDILDARYREGHSTLLTTNCEPSNIDGRIISRYQLGIVPCVGPDMRKAFG